MTGVLLMLVLALSGPPAVAAGEGNDPVRSRAAEAERLNADAMKRFQAADYAGGIDLLEKAFVLSANPDVRLNVAVAYEQWPDHCAEALQSYATYFQLCVGRPCAHVDAARKREAMVKERCVADVRVESQPAGAAIRIDDAAVGSAPVSAKLGRGSHRVVAELSGHKTADQRVEVKAEQGQTVTMRLVTLAPGRVPAKATPAVSAAPEPAAEPGLAPLRLAGWVSLGVGGAAAGAGTLFFVWHLDERDKRNEAADDLTVSNRRLKAIEDDANRDWVLAWTGFGVGAAGVAAGATLLVLSYADPTSAPVAWTPVIGPGHAAILGRF